MNADPSAPFEQAALKLAGVSAAVVAPDADLRWCTDGWRDDARGLPGSTPQALAGWLLDELAISDNQSSDPSETVIARELTLDGGPRVRVLAQPVGGRGWLMVLQHAPGDPLPIDLHAAAPRTSVDSLTGLPDRGALESRLSSRFALADPFALLFIDLDGFKQVNDALGHLSGDQTLRETARRMRDSIREQDFLARFGGDEFVAIIEGIESPEALAPVFERLRRSLRPPLPLESEEVRVSASIGAALSIDGYESWTAMLHSADSRMYASRRPAPEDSRG